MPKTIETTVYKYEEMEDKAKEKAREWYHLMSCHDKWWTDVYEDAEQAGIKITEFDIDRGSMINGEFDGKTPFQVAMYIRYNHGVTCETHKTAVKYLQAWEVLGPEPDDHTNTPSGDYDYDTAQAWEKKKEDIDVEFKQAILEDYLSTLRQEYEYKTSKECIEENIIANEYTFTAKGKRFG